VPSFGERLAERTVLIADGATGTNYQNMGIEPGVAPEEWVVDEPDKVQELHRRFLAAGSEIVLTCSFGGTSLRLADERLAGRAVEVNRRAAELARAAVGGDVLVAGSLGPTGHLTEPLGPLTHDLCVATYAEQAKALADGGVDLLVLETFFSLDEGLWALEGIRTTSELPLVVSYSYDQGTKTMMGLSPTQVVEAFAPLGIAAIGANCGKSLADTDLIVEELVAVADGLPLWVKPNAGVPRMVGDAVIYDAGPEDLAAHVAGYVERGVRIVGGCCGSTPEHVAAIAKVLLRRAGSGGRETA
jgi:5-methyltetrahydrofolate--homocysteine methyltransferase